MLCYFPMMEQQRLPWSNCVCTIILLAYLPVKLPVKSQKVAQCNNMIMLCSVKCWYWRHTTSPAKNNKQLLLSLPAGERIHPTRTVFQVRETGSAMLLTRSRTHTISTCCIVSSNLFYSYLCHTYSITWPELFVSYITFYRWISTKYLQFGVLFLWNSAL